MNELLTSGTLSSQRSSSPIVKRGRPGQWVAIAAVAIFLLYALNFLYFFVDDEGIPFVYAQNVLGGHGLIYSDFEGKIEGYTDFLHVVTSVFVLLLVRVAGWPKLSVFFAGKALSLVAGAATIALVFQTLRRQPAVRPPAAIAGLALLALAGPLAVWSCSSLETAPFAFLIALLLFALASASSSSEPAARFNGVAAVSGSLALLERLDGFVYVGALLAAFGLYASRARREELLKRVVVPIGAVFVIYHAWRIWYFGDLLNMPLYAKVMYKLRPHANVLAKAPALPYWFRFAQLYRWPAVAVVSAAAVCAAWRDRAARPVLLATALITVYIAVVGDWMFGFRFFVPLLPLAALLLALTLSILFEKRAAVLRAATFVIVLWCAVSAHSFERQYEQTEGNPSWLREPSFDAGRFFGPYFKLLEMARDRVGKGALVAYNQAGFLPFMLDLQNVDDLGICSRFYAELPTRDIFFTEVGRYSPLTPKRSVRAEEAYLLYRDVPFLIQRRDLLRSANGGRVPGELIAGYYSALPAAPGTADVIYRRTGRDASEYKQDPRLFFENVAHVAYLRSASVDNRPLAPSEIGPRFPFLREATGKIETTGAAYTLDLQLADAEVSELDINTIWATSPVKATLVILSGARTPRYTATIDLDRRPRELFDRLPQPVQASWLRIQIASSGGEPVNVWLTDLRVQGQTPELAKYIRQTLVFPRG